MNSTFFMRKIVKYTQYSPHFRIKNALFLISLSNTSIFRDALTRLLMNYKTFIARAILLTLLAAPALAVDKSEVKKKWHTPFDLYLNPEEALKIKTENADGVLFLDVRTRLEIQHIGLANAVDANIPIYLQATDYPWKTKKDGVHGAFKKTKNKNFAAEVSNVLKTKGLSTDAPVIIMCTSGSRAPYAARALHEAGFKKVYTQIEGFEGIKAKKGANKGKRLVNGWKNRNLPWSYKLPASKMYFNFENKPEKTNANS